MTSQYSGGPHDKIVPMVPPVYPPVPGDPEYDRSEPVAVTCAECGAEDVLAVQTRFMGTALQCSDCGSVVIEP